MAMIDDVVERVRALAPQFASLPDSTLNMLAGDAIDIAQEDGFAGNKLVRAAGYLAAHYASVVDAQNSNVKKQTLSVMSIEYLDKAGVSDYLTQYQSMLAALNGGENRVYFY